MGQHALGAAFPIWGRGEARAARAQSEKGSLQGLTVQIRNEAHAARVPLLRRVVQACLAGQEGGRPRAVRVDGHEPAACAGGSRALGSRPAGSATGRSRGGGREHRPGARRLALPDWVPCSPRRRSRRLAARAFRVCQRGGGCWFQLALAGLTRDGSHALRAFSPTPYGAQGAARAGARGARSGPAAPNTHNQVTETESSSIAGVAVESRTRRGCPTTPRPCRRPASPPAASARSAASPTAKTSEVPSASLLEPA